MERTNDHTAYCWDFNEQGYCKTCGAAKNTVTDGPAIKQWPYNTWMQQRRAKLLRDEAEALDKTDWR